MIKVESMLCARHASLDRDSGMLHLLYVLESVLAVGFPVYLPELAVAAFLSREHGDANIVEAECRGFANGEEMFRSTMQLNFQDTLRHHAVVRVNGVVITQPSEFRIELSLGGQPASTYRFAVTQPLERVAQPAT